MAGKPHYEPTPEQIAAECAKIRAEKQAKVDAGGQVHCDKPKYDKRTIKSVIDGRKEFDPRWDD